MPIKPSFKIEQLISNATGGSVAVKTGTRKELFEHYELVLVKNQELELDNAAKQLFRFTELTSQQIISMDLTSDEIDNLTKEARWLYKQRAKIFKDK